MAVRHGLCTVQVAVYTNISQLNPAQTECMTYDLQVSHVDSVT